MRGEAEEGTGFRLTGSILGAGRCWRDDGDSDVEEGGWEGEGWNLGRPRSIMFGDSFQGFDCHSIVVIPVQDSDPRLR